MHKGRTLFHNAEREEVMAKGNVMFCLKVPSKIGALKRKDSSLFKNVK